MKTLKNLIRGQFLSVLAVGFLFSQGIQKQVFINSKKIINIQTSKNDPPRIAFEIVNKKMTIEKDPWMDLKNKPPKPLISGNSVLTRPEITKVYRFKEYLISHKDFEFDKAIYASTGDSRYEANQGSLPLINAEGKREIASRGATESWQEGLSDKQKSWISEAENRNGLSWAEDIEKPIEGPTLKDEIKRLSSLFGMKRESTLDQGYQVTSSGVYISGEGALQNRRESDHAGDDIAMNQLNSNSTNQSYSSSGSNYSKNSTINKASALKGPSGKESGSEEIRFESSGNLVASNFLSSSVGRSQKQASKINEDENDSNSFFSSNKLVTGQIELKGLPPPNGTDWRLMLSRYDAGVKVDDGYFNEKDSQYSIRVSEPEGRIVASLIDVKTGEVVGEGSVRVDEIFKNGKSKIVLTKVPHFFAASLTNFYDSDKVMNRSLYAKRQPETQVMLASLDTVQNADKEGRIQLNQIHKNSWLIVRGKRSHFSESVYISPAGEENSLPMIPEKMTLSLKSIIQDQKMKSENPITGSIIFGQVIRDGKPVAGAEVKLQSAGSYQPIYFNSYFIPDSQLKVTSESGYFAFMDVPEGLHTVLSTDKQVEISYENVLVENDVVSPVLLKFSSKKSEMTMRVFDGFSGQPQRAHLRLQSFENDIFVQGFSKIKFSDLRRWGLVMVHPDHEGYLKFMSVYNDSDDYLDLPLIREDWLKSFQEPNRSMIEPRLGTVIGFVPDFHFKVYLGHDENFKKENIIYFDAQGNPTDRGVPGGGFIMMNVPMGVQSIVVSDINSEMIHSQIVPIEEESNFVLRY